MLAFLNQYANLINFVLFGTIIGFLVHLVSLSRTALIDKYEAQLETLQKQLTLLQGQDSINAQNHEAAVKLLERHVAFYKAMADMPEDKRLMAIKTELQQKVEELEAELKARGQTQAKLSIDAKGLREEAQAVAISSSPTKVVATRILEQVIKTMLQLYH